MSKLIRIGTRDSRLAVWQATQVQALLLERGVSSELVHIKSEGDTDLTTPLYAMGVQGVFVRALDAALLSGRIDLAVHSMKDVPVQLASGVVQAAILPRASARDVLVPREGAGFLDSPLGDAVIATGSLRRRAQWLHRYPRHRVEDLRGNVQTRLAKLRQSEWDGAVFAAAGLDRIGERPPESVELDWMLPAPAQGIILAVCRTGDEPVLEACAPLHDRITAACAGVERSFLAALMGGCSTPIGAYARLLGGRMHFNGNVCAPDGSMCLSVDMESSPERYGELGLDAARTLLAQGASGLVKKNAAF